MKVFEVIIEYSTDESKEVITERQYVTAENNTIKAVTDYFTENCRQLEKDLIGVREVLVIVQNIAK